MRQFLTRKRFFLVGFTLCNDRNVSQDDEMMVIEVLAAVVVIRYLVCTITVIAHCTRSMSVVRIKHS